MISLLLGCGLRRSEVVGLKLEAIQHREDHWAIVNLLGKAGRVRTVPIPAWVKVAVDVWAESVPIVSGKLFTSIRKNGIVWGNGITQNVVWYVVKACAKRVDIKALAPHDSRGPPPVCAMLLAANWNRSNFFWEMHPSRPQSATSDANKISTELSMIVCRSCCDRSDTIRYRRPCPEGHFEAAIRNLVHSDHRNVTMISLRSCRTRGTSFTRIHMRTHCCVMSWRSS